jgi:hypothetical protein
MDDTQWDDTLPHVRGSPTIVPRSYPTSESLLVELLAGLPGLGAKFVRVDSRNKTRLRPGLQDISSPGAGLNPTDPRDILM